MLSGNKSEMAGYYLRNPFEPVLEISSERIIFAY